MEKKKSKFSNLRLASASTSNINKSNKLVSSQLSRFFEHNVAGSSSNFNSEKESKSSETENGQELQKTEINNPSNIEQLPSVSNTLLKLEKTAEKIKAIKKRKKVNTDTTITKFLNINDENDFETPKKPKIVTKKKPKTRRKKDQTDIRNMIRTNQNSDEERLYNAIIAHSALENVDPNQLIYSVALSRSMVETSFSQTEQDQLNENNELSNIKSTQERIAEIQHTLEKFGFKGKHGFTEDDFNNITNVNFKSRKKYKTRRRYSEFHYKSLPEKVEILLVKELRNELVNEGPLEHYNVLSTYLTDLHNEGKQIFKIQSSPIEDEFNIDKYYTGGLLKPTTIKSGYLLKNWSNIPGRDKSPVKFMEVEELNNDEITKFNEETEIDEFECTTPTKIDDPNNIDEFECTTPTKIDDPNNMLKSPDLFASFDFGNDDDDRSNILEVISSKESAKSNETDVEHEEVKDSMDVTFIIANHLIDQADIIDLTQNVELPAKKDIHLHKHTEASDIEEDLVLSISSSDSCALTVPSVLSIKRALLSPQMSRISEKSDDESTDIIDLSTSFLKCDHTPKKNSFDLTQNSKNLEVSSIDKLIFEFPCNFAIERALLSPQISSEGSDNESNKLILPSTSFSKADKTPTKSPFKNVSFGSHLSQESQSDAWEIFDEEINYSIRQSEMHKTKSFSDDPTNTCEILAISSDTTISEYDYDDQLTTVANSIKTFQNLKKNSSNHNSSNASNHNSSNESNHNSTNESNHNSSNESNHNSTNESLLITNEKCLLEESFICDTDNINNVNVLNESINELIFKTITVSNSNETKKRCSLNKSRELRKYVSEPLLLKGSSTSNTYMLNDNESSEDEFDKLVAGKKKDLVTEVNKIPSNILFNNEITEAETLEISSDDNDNTIINESFHKFLTLKKIENQENLNLDLEVEKISSSNNQNHKESFEISSDENDDNNQIVKSFSQEISPENVKLNQSKTYPNETYIYKTRNITPKPDYQNMKLDVLCNELKKFGIKRLSHRRAVMMLEHIYKHTHPNIEVSDDDDEIIDMNVSLSQPPNIISNLEIKYGLKQKEDKKKITNREQCEIPEIKQHSCGIDFNYIDKDCNLLGDDGFTGNLLKDEEYILPSKPRGKIHSCLVPLNIAFNNLLKSNSKLKTAILCYEPIELDKLYLFFKENGFKYENDDLIAFLDRRCITFHTKNTRK